MLTIFLRAITEIPPELESDSSEEEREPRLMPLLSPSDSTTNFIQIMQMEEEAPLPQP